MDTLEAFCMQICEDTRSQLERHVIHLRENEDTQNHNEEDSLYNCGPAIVDLLWRQARTLCEKQGDWALLQRRLDDLISLSKEKFYAFPFKDVPECWRRLFTDSSILKACLLVIQARLKTVKGQDVHVDASSTESSMLNIMVQTLDLAIIMTGAPGIERRGWIEKIMYLLEPLCEPSSVIEEARLPKRRKLDSISEDENFPKSTAFVPSVQHPVARAVAPSFNKFEKYMALPRDPDIGPRPLIIESVIEHWPARNERPWKLPSYLLSKTLNGRRLVPVEIGRSYVDDGWGQKIISFKEFMNNYLLQRPTNIIDSTKTPLIVKEPPDDNAVEDDSSQGSRTGYLAQHDLFTQIPSLRADISIPDYCYTHASLPHPSSPLAAKHSAMRALKEPLLNAWLGPAGTISPMHVDPYHNILAQVVGRKYIRLYAPGQSAKLYPRGIEDGGVDMCNTSAMDIGVLEGWDGTKEDQEEALRKYPLYNSAEYVDLILEEGECLYIPLGWWHYVRSLSVSFSVSFWWN
jgi:hypothetical protein